MTTETTLTEYFQYRNGQLPPSSTFAHLIIDAQKGFCDPAYIPPYNPGYITGASVQTDSVAKKIATVMPDFRSAQIYTMIVYYGFPNDQFELANGGPHLIKLEPNDIIVRKTEPSAFEGTNINTLLKSLRIENLLVSGFYASTCVQATVLAALYNSYRVALLQDCIGEHHIWKNAKIYFLDSLPIAEPS